MARGAWAASARTEPFRSRSIGLCLLGHHPLLSMGENIQRLGLKVTFPLLCPRSPGLGPRSLLGYLIIVDSLVGKRPKADAGIF